MRAVEPIMQPETVSSSGELVLCRRCRALHRVSNADRAPLFGDDESFKVVDDRERFLLEHGGHELRLLWRTNDAEIRDRPRSDPMALVTWEMTDGDETFLVTAERRSVREARTYRIRRGHLATSGETVEVDTRILTSLLDEELYPYAAPQDRLEAVVQCLRELVQRTRTELFQPVDEDRSNPSVQLACLPPCVAEVLSRRVAELFPWMEARGLQDLIEKELSESIPVVRIHRRYEIREG